MAEESQAIVADEHGNFDSPALKALQDVWDEYEQEAIEADEVVRVIDRIEAYVKSQIEEMEKAAESPEVDAHDPNRVVILDGFYDHLRGLEKMRASFAEDNIDLVDEGFEWIQSATNQMVLGYQGLIEDSERMSPKLCVQCRRENDQHAGYCRRCGAILPVVGLPAEKRLLAVSDESQPQPQSQGEGDKETTPNYIAVADAHQAWRGTEISSEEYLQRLVEVRERHLTQHAATLSILQEDDGSAETAEHLEAVAQGIAKNVEALDAMSDALEAGNLDGLEHGLTKLAEATIELLDIQKQTKKAVS